MKLKVREVGHDERKIYLTHGHNNHSTRKNEAIRHSTLDDLRKVGVYDSKRDCEII